ncbi:MAG: peptidyl-prolyl isomerase, FKBP-type peptidyl-prolyl cis-trans isomerase FkpA [Parcubacteria group bacterium]|nr:peptidyl-prolyl isomerase, FKBP-type peptidyl-prolyl cis-trans isomerase FkpA [Parcubacteria group bacterium]
MQVTSTGIAVALAVVVALGLLFFGPQVFAPFTAQTAATVATSTLPIATSTMDTQNTQGVPVQPNSAAAAAIPNPLPTTLTASDTVVGTGAEAKTGDTVTVNYVGMLPDGTVFDASANHGTTGFSFPLGAGQVIKGWDQGVVGMKVGGKRRLIIPANLAYGNQAVGGVIPANATLVFDIELLGVK